MRVGVLVRAQAHTSGGLQASLKSRRLPPVLYLEPRPHLSSEEVITGHRNRLGAATKIVGSVISASTIAPRICGGQIVLYVLTPIDKGRGRQRFAHLVREDILLITWSQVASCRQEHCDT